MTYVRVDLKKNLNFVMDNYLKDKKNNFSNIRIYNNMFYYIN